MDMSEQGIKELLESVSSGQMEVDKALEVLKKLPYEDIGVAKIDHHRGIRNGFPEVIFCQGKTAEQVKRIVEGLKDKNKCILGTRASKEIYKAVLEVDKDAVYDEMAKTILVGEKNKPANNKVIGVITAGTADMPVAEEAAITAEAMGNHVNRIYDIGVAGIHRLFSNLDLIMEANVLIIVAGMEGALASVVGGLVDKPIIAVPTSVGYGANFGGLAPLLTMLNSCASGIGVVNIDNGFGAGYLASSINNL